MVSVCTNKGYEVDQSFQICSVDSGFSVYTLGHIPRDGGKSGKRVKAKCVSISLLDCMEKEEIYHHLFHPFYIGVFKGSAP